MKIVICANRAPTQPYFLFDQLKASLARYGYEPLILGWGEEWYGLCTKPKWLKRAIEGGRIRDEWMIFCDAFDVIFAGDPERILETSRAAYGDGIVWNAERNCFPDASLAGKHPETASSFKYLNSGFAIGRTADFLNVLKWMDADNIPTDHYGDGGNPVHPNDQDYFMRAFLFSGMDMKLDSDCRICQTLCGVNAEDLEFGRTIVNKETGQSPMAFHFNGPAKTAGFREPIIKALSL